MAALPGVGERSNTASIFITYKQGKNQAELIGVLPEDESAIGTLSVSLDHRFRFRVNIKSFATNLDQRITHIFIEKGNSGEKTLINQERLDDRVETFEALRKNFDSLEESRSMSLSFQTNEGGVPELIIRRGVVQEVSESKESKEEAIGVAFCTMKMFKPGESWVLKLNPENCQRKFSISMKDGKAQFKLSDMSGKEFDLTLVPLEFILETDSQGSATKGKHFPFQNLAETHQKKLAHYILSGRIYTILIKNALNLSGKPVNSFDLLFSAIEGTCPPEVSSILGSYGSEVQSSLD